jgi:PhzF family phenazine biosynthesis protein
VGTHWVLATTGRLRLHPGRNIVHAELGAGVLPVELVVDQGGVLESVFMTQSPPRFGQPFTDHGLVAAALGLEPFQLTVGELHPRVVDTGIPWFLIPLTDRRAVDSIVPRHDLCAQVAEMVGTDLFHAFSQDTGDPSCAVRTRHVWFSGVTPGEDPVTGSAIGCIASYLVNEEVILAMPTAECWIEQGETVGRPGKVLARVTLHDHRISAVEVGGAAVHVGDGELWLPESDF